MTAHTSKILSMGLVGAMVGYCCWPYVFGLGQGAATPATDTPAAIAASALLPSIDPAPDRDPFRVATPAQAVTEPSTDAAHDEASAEFEFDAGTERGDELESDANRSLGRLALSATFVRGDQRVALINGRVYAPGEPLADSGSSASPFVVSEIFADKVVIERNGQTTELSYSDHDSTTRPAAQANTKHAVPRPAAATKRHPNIHGSSAPKQASSGQATKGPARP